MRAGVVGVPIVGFLLVTGCASNDSAVSEGTEQGLFVVTAGGAEVDEASDGTIEIALSDVDQRAMWFTDRPERLADVVAVEDLVAAWDELGFVDLPPNAGLVLSDANGESTVIITMLEPEWFPEDGVLRMRGRPLAEEDLPGDHSLGAQVGRVVDELPDSVEHAALFIDPAMIPTEFEKMPASCVAVPHVGGPTDGDQAPCIPVADLDDFSSGGAAPGPPE